VGQRQSIIGNLVEGHRRDTLTQQLSPRDLMRRVLSSRVLVSLLLTSCAKSQSAPETEGSVDETATGGESGCGEGHPDACLELVRSRDLTFGVTDEEVLRGYLEVCGWGSGEACVIAARRLRASTTPNPNESEAVELLELACDFGYARGCVEAARALQPPFGRDGERGDIFEARGVRLWESGCGEQRLEDCIALGVHHHSDGHLQPEMGNYYLRLACDGGDGEGCLTLAHYLDDEEAMGLARRACELEVANACRYVGRALEDEGSADEAVAYYDRAIELWESACDEDPYQCGTLAAVLSIGGGPPADATRARTFEERACRGGDAFSCHSLGDDFRWGHGVAADDARAIEFLTMACSLGYSRGCDDEQLLRNSVEGQPGEFEARLPVSATPRLRNVARNCDAGNRWLCAQVPGAFLEGSEGLSIDYDAAIELFNTLCQPQGEAVSCLRLADIYEEGIGVERDTSVAESYLGRAIEYMRIRFLRHPDRDDLPVASIFASSLGLGPMPSGSYGPDLIMAIWPDRTAIWSENPAIGGQPYHAGEIDLRALDNTLNELRQQGIFDARFMYSGRVLHHGQYTEISVEYLGHRLHVSSGHELDEVAVDAEFLAKWNPLREALIGLIPETGERIGDIDFRMDNRWNE
jgi:TPR repeat protein